MRSNRFLFAVLAVLFIAIFAGCSSDKVIQAVPLTADQQAISDAMALLTEFNHDVVSHAIPDTTAGLAASAAAQYFWWREYTSNTPTLSIVVNTADTQNPNPWADVSLSTSYSGLFHVVYRDNAGAYTHTTRTITDQFNQTARFEQTGLVTGPNLGWTLVLVSNIVGGSNPTSLTISSLYVLPSTSSAHYYDALTFDDLSSLVSLIVLETDEQVNVTVQSGAGANRVFRHDFYASGVTRAELTNVDLGYYTQGLNTPTALSTFDANRVMVMDVIAPGVIDGSATYESIIWAVPYRINVSGAPS